MYFELLISFDLSAHYLEKKIRQAKPTGRSSSFPDLILSPVRGWIDAGFDHERLKREHLPRYCYAKCFLLRRQHYLKRLRVLQMLRIPEKRYFLMVLALGFDVSAVAGCVLSNYNL